MGNDLNTHKKKDHLLKKFTRDIFGQDSDRGKNALVPIIRSNLVVDRVRTPEISRKTGLKGKSHKAFLRLAFNRFLRVPETRVSISPLARNMLEHTFSPRSDSTLGKLQ